MANVVYTDYKIIMNVRDISRYHRIKERRYLNFSDSSNLKNIKDALWHYALPAILFGI
jgi:hypothetical protein